MASNRLNFGKIIASAVYKNGDNSFIRINGDFTSGSPNVTAVVNNVGGNVNLLKNHTFTTVFDEIFIEHNLYNKLLRNFDN